MPSIHMGISPSHGATELFTLAGEYHYDNHACHTYIFPPRWPTLQQNIKVNRGENCMGDTCGTWHHRSFTRVHVMCMNNQPFSIFLWWWCHAKRHICSVAGYRPRPQWDAQRDRGCTWHERYKTSKKGLPSRAISYIVLSKWVQPLKIMSFWNQGCNYRHFWSTFSW